MFYEFLILLIFGRKEIFKDYLAVFLNEVNRWIQLHAIKT